MSNKTENEIALKYLPLPAPIISGREFSNTKF